jgi:hypothetical protein
VLAVESVRLPQVASREAKEGPTCGRYAYPDPPGVDSSRTRLNDDDARSHCLFALSRRGPRFAPVGGRSWNARPIAGVCDLGDGMPRITEAGYNSADRGRKDWLGPSPLRTVQADLPHTALQLMVLLQRRLAR